MSGRLPVFERIEAPARWQAVDIISDLHLDPSQPRTVEAWQRYMASATCDALFILGDLFEVWVGDDSALEPGFEAECAKVLRDSAARMPLYFMHGNRDFLVGEKLLRSCGVQLVEDPAVLDFAGTRWLLTHGDALCIGDVDYMKFREKVRAPQWQHEFLAKPLSERQAIARDLRKQSETIKQSGIEYADIDEATAIAWMRAAGTDVLVHGHTHRPADHMLGDKRRIVLSDWDAEAKPARLQVMRLSTAGAQRVSLA